MLWYVLYFFIFFIKTCRYNIYILKRYNHRIILHFAGYCVVYSQVTIPEALKECYINRTKNEILLPLNIRTFIDILRKAEIEAFTTMDMRTFSSSLLHRYKKHVEYL